MTDVAEFLADAGRGRRTRAEKEVPLDRYNRYVLPDPETGEEKAWTRATTYAGAVKETFGIARWENRLLAQGLALSPDLLAVAALDVAERGTNNFNVAVPGNREANDRLDKAIANAMERAGSSQAATLGTTMHRFTELLDSGEDLGPLLPWIKADLDAYVATMEHHGFTPLAIERIVCVPELGVAGTLDRILSRGDAYIGDQKGGKDLGYSEAEISIQLALYAHASYLWDDGQWVPMPPVDQSRAVVMHLPTGEARCDLYWVDIAAGWEMATEVCGRVREWRNRKGLFVRMDSEALPSATPVAGEPDTPSSTAAGPSPDADEGERRTAAPPASEGRPAHAPQHVSDLVDRAAWLVDRIRALAGNERARHLVGLRWPEGVAPIPPWDDTATDRLADMLDDVEAEVGQDFGPMDPATAEQLATPPAAPPEPPGRAPGWDIADDGVEAPEADVEALKATIGFLDDDQRRVLLRWAREARQERRAFADAPMTQRMLACARAAWVMAAHLGDDHRARRALTRVLGGWTEGWMVGPVIGSLTSEQANSLAEVAQGYAAGNTNGIDPF